jgi:hypothetical protein
VNRVVLAAAAGFAACLFFSSCGSSKSTSGPPSGLHQRVLASQTVSAGFVSPGLIIVNGAKDILPRASEIGAVATPSFIVPSPNLATFLVYGSTATSYSVQVVNTLTESSTGSITLPGPSSSIVFPLAAGPAFAAVPSALVTGAAPGAVEVLNTSGGGISANIGVPGVQTVVSNANGSILLAFSADSDSLTVVIPANINTQNAVTQVFGGFDRPVTAVINGSTAYVLNCGAECGGTQASVQVFDMGSGTLVGPPVNVDGATVGRLIGSTLYVAGNSPTNNACTGETTAATTCGRLDLVDTSAMAVTSTAVITDGTHTLLDLSLGGQLFIGAKTCTNIGSVTNPNGQEVRGCLSIYNTNTGAVVIPPDNGDVTGLQNFTSRFVEYVAQGGHLRIYDTNKDVLQSLQLNLGGGVIYDAKSADFF